MSVRQLTLWPDETDAPAINVAYRSTPWGQPAKPTSTYCCRSRQFVFHHVQVIGDDLCYVWECPLCGQWTYVAAAGKRKRAARPVAADRA